LGFKSSTVRSSVTIRIMLGGLALSSLGVCCAEGKQAESVKQAASSKRKGKPPKANLKRGLAPAAADDRGTSTAAVYPVRDSQAKGRLTQKPFSRLFATM